MSISMISELAYLDPGAGSMVLQALLGGIAGVLVLLKLYWRRIVRLLTERRASEAVNGRNT
jgi:hypothetical protein